MNLRRHVWRSELRTLALAFCDLATALLLGGALTGLRAAEELSTIASSFLVRHLLQIADAGLAQMTVAFLFGMAVAGTYAAGDGRRDPSTVLKGSAIAVALSTWHLLWNTNPANGLLSYGFTVLIVGAAVLAERLVLDAVARKVRSHTIRTVFVGEIPECLEASSGAAFRAGTGHQVVGIIDLSAGETGNAREGVQSLRAILLEERPECVVVCGPLEDVVFRRVVEASRDFGCQLLAVPRTFRVTGVEPQLVWRQGQPLIELTSPAIRGRELRIKRLLDIVGAGIGLLLLSPLFITVAIAIKLDSRGSVFFQSRRYGRYGTVFGMWKFRSMVANASAVLDRDPRLKSSFLKNQKLREDPRITRVGRWLRRTSIDELPQLFNVLVGDMSLVGPRPKLEDEADRYAAAFDTVLSVRPGMTGLWQVSGRSSTTYDERIALDVQYASHASIWSDLAILVKTIPTVLLARGAH